MYHSAIRIGSFLALEWDDLDLTRGYIHVVLKGGEEGEEKWVPLWEESVKALKEYSHWIKFKDRKVFPYTANEIRSLLKELATRAKIKKRVYPHLFRHTRATHLRQEGHTLPDIGDLLCHKSLESTRIYADIQPEQLKKKFGPGAVG